MTTGHTCSSEGHVNNKPIVFIGPSMPLAEAAGIIDADFRPPCKRGDIAQLPPTSIVALIDGELWAEYDGGDHTLAVARVLDLGADPGRRPLLYHRGAYGLLQEPG